MKDFIIDTITLLALVATIYGGTIILWAMQ